MIFQKMHHLAAFRLGLSVFLLVSLVWQVAAADVLVLRNGGRIEGTLANREVVVRDPLAFSYVSFLLLPANRAPELLSFDVEEIEYILIEADGDTRVIDFHVHRTMPTPATRTPTTEQNRSRDVGRGVAMIAFGLGIGIFAAVNPFEENWQYANYTTGYARINTGDTYNAANYILMGVGVVSILAGATLINRHPTTSGSETSTSIWAMPRGAGLRKSWNF